MRWKPSERAITMPIGIPMTIETTVPTKIMAMVFIASTPHIEIADQEKGQDSAAYDLPVAAGNPGNAANENDHDWPRRRRHKTFCLNKEILQRVEKTTR